MVAWRISALALGLIVLVAYIALSGKWVTTNAEWYLSLNAPAWQPPNWVFGLVWPYNFLILGLSAVLIALRSQPQIVFTFLLCFSVSVVFAVLWAYRFYIDHAMTSAAICLSLAAILTIPVVVSAFLTHAWLGWLVVPYQVWVVLATSLSWGYAALNSSS